MTQNLLCNFALKAAIFIAFGGLVASCDQPPFVRFDAIVPGGKNLIENGSFEANSEAAFEGTNFQGTNTEPIEVAGGPGGVHSKHLCGSSSSLAPWVVTRVEAKKQDCSAAQSGGAYITMNWYDVQNNTRGISVPSGRMAVNLFGSVVPGKPGLGTLTQTVHGLLPGYNYALVFWVGSSNVFNPNGRVNSIQVDVADVVDGNIGASHLSESFTAPIADAPSDWIPIVRQFLATESSITISFTASARNGGDGLFVGLDDVGLRCVGPQGYIFLEGC